MTTPIVALAISASEFAELLSISRRHLLTLHNRGKLPRPLHLGRSVRWSLEEIRAWLAAGAPDQQQWVQMHR
ncbi:MAG: helix-turn-helix transcriptional regulator [Pirellulaceae bacterium]